MGAQRGWVGGVGQVRKQGGEKVKENHLRAAVVEIYDGFMLLCLHACIFRTLSSVKRRKVRNFVGKCSVL